MCRKFPWNLAIATDFLQSVIVSCNLSLFIAICHCFLQPVIVSMWNVRDSELILLGFRIDFTWVPNWFTWVLNWFYLCPNWFHLCPELILLGFRTDITCAPNWFYLGSELILLVVWTDITCVPLRRGTRGPNSWEAVGKFLRGKRPQFLRGRLKGGCFIYNLLCWNSFTRGQNPETFS